MNAAVLIRLATAGDAERLPDIERSSGEAFRPLPDLAWIADDDVMSTEQHAELISENGVWIAEMKGRIVGFISAAAAPDALHIWQMAVSHDAQGKGIGRALLNVAIEAARRRGVNSVTLTTFRDVVWNAPFYARSGFRILAPGELDDRLRSVLAKEVEHGLPGERRCAMALTL